LKTHDTVKYEIDTGKASEVVKFEVGNLVMCTGGRNLGRIGVISHRERHPGSFDIVQIKDLAGQSFATRISNVFVIGKGNKPLVSIPRRRGIKRTPLEEAQGRHKGDTSAEVKA
jgi:small subunit ribosomal protein S4e